MKNRIFGLETEYNYSVKGGNESQQSVIPFSVEFIRKKNIPVLFKKKYGFFQATAGSRLWLANGGSMYIDLDLPEFCTPECSSIRQLVIYDKAGEKFVWELLNSLQKLVPSDNKEEFLVIKNTRGLGFEPNCLEVSNGCHENYGFFITKKDLNEELLNKQGLKTLISFLITRQILDGSGYITFNKRNNRFFLISQRADFIYTILNSTTQNARPIICLKNESLVDNFPNFKRFHLICGDLNMSEFSTFLKVGTTHLIIRMIQENFLKKVPEICQPLATLKIIAQDYEIKNKYDISDFGINKMSALEIQRFFCDMAVEFLAKSDNVDQEEWEIVELWDKILTSLKISSQDLNNKLDWRIKFNIFENYLKKHNCSWNDLEKTIKIRDQKGKIRTVPIIERLRALDLAYHVIGSTGVYNQLVKKGHIQRLTTDEEIEFALNHPPEDTRAYMRGEIVKIIVNSDLLFLDNRFDVGWQNLSLLDNSGNVIGNCSLENPFERTNFKYSLFIRKLMDLL